MPRPVKPRRVCSRPKFKEFGPENCSSIITMTVEEYETIRLIDYKNLTQEECANFMEVARTTVQKLYDDARSKIAKALVEGLKIKIEGGNYQFCLGDRRGRHCQNGACNRKSTN